MTSHALTTGATSVTIAHDGRIERIQHGDLDVTLYRPGLHDPTIRGIYLRRLAGDAADAVELRGPFTVGDTYETACSAFGWDARVRLDVADGEVTFTVDLAAGTSDPGAEFDLVVLQDVSLAPTTMSRSNELYTSHYVVHHAEERPEGWVVASRQTMGAAPRMPVAVLAIHEGAAGFLTDTLDIHGAEVREAGVSRALAAREWDSRIRQGEGAVVALKSAPFAGGAAVRRHVTLTVLPDWRGDLADAAPHVPARVEPAGVVVASPAPATSALATAPLLSGRVLDDGELLALGGGDAVDVERDGSGILSYFTPDGRHVIAGRKDTASERAHGHILLAGVAGGGEILAATAFSPGSFASHIVLGNTEFHRVVSVHRDPLNLLRSSGTRVLVGGRLLGLPSALVLEVGRVTWVYETDQGRIDVVLTAAAEDHLLTLDVHADRDLDLVATIDLDLEMAEWEPDRSGGRVTVTAPGSERLAARSPGLTYVFASTEGTFGDDAVLWSDGQARDPGGLILSARTARLRIAVGAAMEAGRAHRLAEEGLTRDMDAEAASSRDAISRFTRFLEIQEAPGSGELSLLLPWLTHNALVHFRSPHGLEQFSGAAWGTRDVCQGPLELALAFDHPAIARDILLTVFAHQTEGGEFPQWFMFDQHDDERATDAHGDVPVWPLLALGQYLEATGDGGILDEVVAYREPDGSAGERTGSILRHVEAIVDYLETNRVEGTSLYGYGHGDWDDTLQPATPDLRESMVSSWTIALLVTAVNLLLDAPAITARGALAAHLEALRDDSVAGLRDLMMPGGVLAGFIHVERGQASPIIHPTDSRTGISYRLISMTQAMVAGVLTDAEVERHLGFIHSHLLDPDGARLMDRPAQFDEGRTTYFQRAEQAAFVGREVGLMYTHAHLRYAEARSLLGYPDAAAELLRVSPVGLRLSSAALRQRNAYYSSSDAAFLTRFEAEREWSRLRTSDVAVNGGWRVYSSGPGIFLRLLVQHVLGLSFRPHGLEIRATPEPLRFRIEMAGVVREVRVSQGDDWRIEIDRVPVETVPVGTHSVLLRYEQVGNATEIRIQVPWLSHPDVHSAPQAE